MFYLHMPDAQSSTVWADDLPRVGDLIKRNTRIYVVTKIIWVADVSSDWRGKDREVAWPHVHTRKAREGEIDD